MVVNSPFAEKMTVDPEAVTTLRNRANPSTLNLPWNKNVVPEGSPTTWDGKVRVGQFRKPNPLRLNCPE
ncbi:MAG: hypothetical protein ACK40X_03620 [Armatimonadota bacterium]